MIKTIFFGTLIISLLVLGAGFTIENAQAEAPDPELGFPETTPNRHETDAYTTIISLDGDNPQSINQNDTYTELGASCIDVVNGEDFSDRIVINATMVDTAIIGEYQVTYDCADDYGNDGHQEIRTVNVIVVNTNVSWQNIVGVSIVDNTDMTKTASERWGNAGASSVQSLPSGDGYVTTTIDERDTHRMIGLSNGDSNQHYSDGDFFIYPGANRMLYVSEDGLFKAIFGWYQTGDILKVAVESDVVKYYQNDILLYTSLQTPVYPLLVDTALYNNGATLKDIQIDGVNWETPVDTVPDAPTNLTATHGNSQVELNWDVPSNDGGSPITDYFIEYSKDDGTTWITFSGGVTSTGTNVLVDGLTNVVEYSFRVFATNVIGTGDPSEIVTVTPATVPDAPIDLLADYEPHTKQSSMILTWTTSFNGYSPITDYLIEYSKDDGTTWITFDDGISTETTTTVTGLTKGVEYSFRVSAVNEIGIGDGSIVES